MVLEYLMISHAFLYLIRSPNGTVSDESLHLSSIKPILVFLTSQMVALFLIGLVIAARTLAYNYTNIPILIGVAVVASFLFLVAVLGLFGACRHHQVILFFVSPSGIALEPEGRRDHFRMGWGGVGWSRSGGERKIVRSLDVIER